MKGSTGTASSVELTNGEVKNSRDFELTDLYVVDKIAWQRSDDGTIATSGGRVRHLRDWTADREQLSPTRYRYELPDAP